MHDRAAQAGSAAPFRHEALLYSGEAQFLAATLAFIRHGLAAHETVLVAVRPEKLDLLRRRLGPDGDDVSFVDIAKAGRNPATIVPLWSAFVERSRPTGRGFRGVGEPAWPGRSDAALVECRNHEGLLNVAFANGPSWRLLCPYDVDGLGSHVIADVRATHPHLVDGDGSSSSADYDPLLAGWLGRDDPLPPPATTDTRLSAFGPSSLGEIRSVVAAFASRAGLAPRRVEDFVLAMNELVGNSLRHGGGTGEVRLWVEADTVLGEVRDRGSIVDPLAGRRRPSPEQSGGRGLWIVNHVSDLVQIRSRPGSTVVRVHVAR
jgi:anti-sigma regulatory factor (Ser/Thr protein kinase)